MVVQMHPHELSEILFVDNTHRSPGYTSFTPAPCHCATGVEGHVQIAKILIRHHAGRSIVRAQVFVSRSKTVDVELDSFFLGSAEDHTTEATVA